jgi:hypothetical protein
MRHIDFDPSAPTGEQQEEWAKWERRAAKARDECLDQVRRGERPTYKSKIWTDLKTFLLDNVFHGKCGYCESMITDVTYGAADHYRPKGRVTVMNGQKLVPVSRRGKTHCGYYWLAYDWRNLIPACDMCNSGDAKVDQFPVANKHAFPPHRRNPPDWDKLETSESPLLLHPYRDDPDAHLQFGKAGTVAAREGSRLGKESIEAFKLTRTELVTTRSDYQEKALDAYLMRSAVSDAIGMEALEPYFRGVKPHSTAAIQFVQLRLNEMSGGVAARRQTDD